MYTNCNRKNAIQTDMMSSDINILIACEESQAETMAFREAGFNTFSCDIQPCKKGTPPQFHICGDVTPFLAGKTSFVTEDGNMQAVSSWHFILAHPPCTYLCKVGSRWLYKDADMCLKVDDVEKWVNRERWKEMRKARKFFLACLNANAPFVAVENPIPMKMAQLPPPSCYASPHWFGSKYTKKTLYWTKNLPPLMATFVNGKAKSLTDSTRGKYRSRTDRLLAEAIVNQWGYYILDKLKIL